MRFLKYFFIIIILYIAIFLSISRFLIIYAENNTKSIEDFFNKNYLVNIEIIEINGNWLGLYPSLNVKVKNENKREDFQYSENIKLNLNIYKSLFLFKPVIKSIVLENFYYKNSLENLKKNINLNTNSKKFNIDNIVLKNSSFIIEHKNYIYNLKNLNIKVDNSTNNIILDGIFDKKRFILNINDINYIKNNLNSFNYALYIKGVFDYNFLNVLHKYNIELINSNLEVNFSGFYKNNAYIDNKVSIKSNPQSTIKVNNRNFKNVNLKLIFLLKKNNFLNFEIKDLSFFSDKSNLYKLTDFAGFYDIGKNHISIYSKKVDLNFKNFFDDYDIKINDLTSFSGLIKNVNFSLNTKDLSKNFYFSGNFYKTNITFKNHSVLNFTGYIEFNNTDLYVAFNSKKINFNSKKYFKNNIYLSDINGSLKVLNFKKPSYIFNNISLISNDIDITVSGFVNQNDDKVFLNTNVNFLDLKNIKKYFPIDLISNKNIHNLSRAFLKGYSKNSRILLNGNLSDLSLYNNFYGNIFAFFPIYDLTLEYKKGVIPFENIKGLLYVNNESAFFVSSIIKVLNTELTGTTLKVNDLKKPILLINSNVFGPFSDLLKYSNRAQLSNLKEENINKLKGIAKTKIMFSIDFTREDTVNDFYTGNIKFDLLKYSLDNNNIFSELQGQINYKGSKFFTEKNEYITGMYNNYPIKFSLNNDTNGDFIIKGNHILDLNDIITNKLYKDNIKGKSKWMYEVIVPAQEGRIKFLAKSDLNGTEIIFPQPFYKKSNSNNSIKIEASLENNIFKDIKFLYNNIYSEIDSIDNFNGYINFSGIKKDIPKNGFNIYGKINNINIDDWKKISKNHNETSGIKYKNYLSSVKNIDINISEFKSGEIALDNLYINGFNDGKNFIFNKVNVNSDNLVVDANGKSEFNNISTFNVKLYSKNLENLLNSWGFKNSLRDSSVESDFNFSWKGDLFDFSLDKIYGKFSIKMKDGRLKKVDNRFSKIFGIFNMEFFAKRLRLNFDDITKNGFYFKSLGGDFRIENGNIFTTNLSIQGSSIELLAIGSTNIIKETYDMQVLVTPELGDTLPTIALLGGPIAAAATFAVKKIADALGKDIDNLLKIRYKVYGSWDNPEIKLIEKDFNIINNLENLFE